MTQTSVSPSKGQLWPEVGRIHPKLVAEFGNVIHIFLVLVLQAGRICS